MTQTKLDTFSDDEIWEQTKKAAQDEKKATLSLLEYLHEVERRKLFAARAYSSLFEYVTKVLGYSEMQASERINAMRLMVQLPEVKEKIQAGKLSLSTASQVQRFFRAEKKHLKSEKPQEQKLRLVELCESRPKREVEKILCMQSQGGWSKTLQERVLTRVMPGGQTELRFQITDFAYERLQRVRDYKGALSLGEIFERALEVYLKEIERKIYGKNFLSPKPMELNKVKS